MRRISRMERRSLLWGWCKWVLVVIIPFGVLLFDTWLNVQVRHKDYDLGQLNLERRQLDAELDVLHAREAKLNGVEHLTEIAEQLALASPTTQQFQAVAYREAPRRISVMTASDAEIGVASRTAKIALGASPTVTLAQKNGDLVSPALVPAPVVEAAVPVVDAHPGLSASAGAPAPTEILPDPDLDFMTVEDMMGKL